MGKYLSWATLLLLTSCYASADPYSFKYIEVQDKSQILLEPDVKDIPATLVVRREPGFMGSYAATRFVFDGQPIVRLRSGEQHTFKITGGQHIAGSSCDDGFVTRASDTIFDAHPGQTYIFRIHSTQSELCLISPMSLRADR